MIQSLVLFHGIEVDALYLVLDNILKQAGRISTKMLCDYCAFDLDEGSDDMGWTDISDFEFVYREPGIFEVNIKEPYPIEPIKFEDIREEKRLWLMSQISQ